MNVTNPKDLLNLSLVEKKLELSSFAGPFTYDVINTQLVEARAYLEGLKINSKSAKKIYNVLVELLENILKHSDHQENNLAAYMIGRAEKYFFIYTSNYTSQAEVKPLIEKILHYNKLSKDELSKLYKEQIVATQLSDRGGAGLGILNIIIKAENPIEYELMDSEDGKVLFRLFVKINDYDSDTIN